LCNNDVPKRSILGQNEVSKLAISALKRGQKEVSKLAILGLNEISKLAILGQNEIPKRGGNRELEREREEKGSEEGRCCSDGASAGPAASFTVQARPSPVYCRCKKCLPRRHVIVLLGFFFEIFREVLSLLLCLGFFSGGT